MSEDFDWNLEDDETQETVKRFESGLRRNQKSFFDVDDFESIIHHYLIEGNTKLAMEAADMAAGMHPYSVDIQIRRAEVKLENNEVEEAFSLLRMIEKLEPNHPDIQYLIGRIFLIKDEVDIAETSFWNAVQYADDDEVFFLTRISRLFLDRDEYSVAVKFLVRAHAIEPDNVHTLFDLGFAYGHLEQYEESEKYYNKYLDILPFSSLVWYNLGTSYFNRFAIVNAIEAYDMALAVDPQNTQAMFNMGGAYATSENFETALEYFLPIIEFEPNNPWVYTSIGECYEKLEDTEKALENFEKAIMLEPPVADAFYGKAQIFIKKNWLEPALESIEKALDIQPENYDFLISYGSILVMMDYQQEALTVYERAELLNPDEPDAYIGLAEASFYLGDYDKVEEIYNEVASDFADITAFQVVYAASLYKKGSKSKAIHILKKAKEENPQVVEDFMSIIPTIDDYDFFHQLKRI